METPTTNSIVPPAPVIKPIKTVVVKSIKPVVNPKPVVHIVPGAAVPSTGMSFSMKIGIFIAMSVVVIGSIIGILYSQGIIGNKDKDTDGVDASASNTSTNTTNSAAPETPETSTDPTSPTSPETPGTPTSPETPETPVMDTTFTMDFTNRPMEPFKKIDLGGEVDGDYITYKMENLKGRNFFVKQSGRYQVQIIISPENGMILNMSGSKSSSTTLMLKGDVTSTGTPVVSNAISIVNPVPVSLSSCTINVELNLTAGQRFHPYIWSSSSSFQDTTISGYVVIEYKGD